MNEFGIEISDQLVKFDVASPDGLQQGYTQVIHYTDQNDENKQFDCTMGVVFTEGGMEIIKLATNEEEKFQDAVRLNPLDIAALYEILNDKTNKQYMVDTCSRYLQDAFISKISEE